MSSVASANIPSLVSRAAAREAVRKAVRLYVGRGRHYSVKQLSNGTGVPDRLIECAICDPEGEDFRPLSLEHLLSISAFLGDNFTTEWLRLSKQGAFALGDEDLPPPAEVVADIVRDASAVATCAADGKFSEQDERTLRDVGHREVVRGVKLVSVGGTAK
jgi:hypothetical protein